MNSSSESEASSTPMRCTSPTYIDLHGCLLSAVSTSSALTSKMRLHTHGARNDGMVTFDGAKPLCLFGFDCNNASARSSPSTAADMGGEVRTILSKQSFEPLLKCAIRIVRLSNLVPQHPQRPVASAYHAVTALSPWAKSLCVASPPKLLHTLPQWHVCASLAAMHGLNSETDQIPAFLDSQAFLMRRRAAGGSSKQKANHASAEKAYSQETRAIHSKSLITARNHERLSALDKYKSESNS